MINKELRQIPFTLSQDFALDGTPLREKSALYSNDGRRSRQLPLNRQTDEIQLVEFPNRYSRYKRSNKNGNRNFINYIKNQLQIKDEKWFIKRDVTGTSERVVGSFDDSFLDALIDDFNATCKYTDNEGSLVPCKVQ